VDSGLHLRRNVNVGWGTTTYAGGNFGDDPAKTIQKLAHKLPLIFFINFRIKTFLKGEKKTMFSRQK
jgi:hypothetical protein